MQSLEVSVASKGYSTGRIYFTIGCRMHG